jgi:uncharacterized membrane protein
MWTLLTGLVLFHAGHLVPTHDGLRNSMVARMGRGGYLAVFSVVSLIALILIVMGYGDTRSLGRANPQLWIPPPWMRHIAYLLMLPAFILLAAAYIPSRIRDWAQHPMLAAIKVWALAHLLVRGDLASVLLFGSFLAYGIYDRISVKRRGARGPLGDARGSARSDVIVIAIGLAAYAAMLAFGHRALIGVALMRVSFAP